MSRQSSTPVDPSSTSVNSAQMELEAARAEVMSAEKEIVKIKNALKALSISATSKPASSGAGTTDEKDSGGSLSSDSGDGDENSLKVYATKMTGLSDKSKPTIHLQLSSPIESRTITTLFDPLDLKKEGSFTIFRGVETDMATLEFKVEDENLESVEGSHAMDKSLSRMIGSSAAYSVIPMCEIDYLGGGVKRKVTELNVAIVPDNDSAGASPNTNVSDVISETKNEDEKTNTNTNGSGSEEKTSETKALDNVGQEVITDSKENNSTTTEANTNAQENDEMIMTSDVDAVKDEAPDKSLTKIGKSTDDDDVFLDAITKEESSRGLTCDPEFLDSKSEEDAVLVPSASVVEDEVANATISNPDDLIPPEEDVEKSTTTTNDIETTGHSTDVEDGQIKDTVENSPDNNSTTTSEEDVPSVSVVEDVVVNATTSNPNDVITPVEDAEKSSTITNDIDTTDHSADVDGEHVQGKPENPTATNASTTLDEKEDDVPPPKEKEETNSIDAPSTEMIEEANGGEISSIPDGKDEEQSSFTAVTESTSPKSISTPALLLPNCTIDIHIEFNPSTKDEKNGLSDLLENASIKKAQAINRLRKAAEAINRVKQSTSEGTATTMVTKSEGAVKAGFLNRPTKASIKNEPSGLVKWYRRVLGPQSLVRVAFPVAKNYLMFIGGLIMMHYQGYQLALPPPV